MLLSGLGVDQPLAAQALEATVYIKMSMVPSLAG
jgi:hypothetical protein